MENTMTANQTFELVPSTTSGFGMPSRGCAFGDLRIPATGLATIGSVIRDRQDVAAKGHVGLVAYVPGNPAWSPPIC